VSRIHRRIAAAVCLGLLAPVAISTASGGAIDQDLVVSATSGAPGDVIDVSSASCAPIDDGGDTERFLRVLIITGSGADEVLAGVGWGYGSTSVIVPDWTDPDAPAVIEASCVTSTFDFGSGYVDTTEAYDPVAFDILPGAGSPTQSSSLSRDSLLVGRAFESAATGCASDEDFGAVELWDGGDLSGRNTETVAAFGYGEVVGGAYEAQVDLIDRSWGVSWSSNGTDIFDVQARSGATVIPAGTYTAVSYCATYDEGTDTETFLVLPPQLVEITGDAPIDEAAMAVEAGTPNGTFSGTSCTAGDVEGSVEGMDLVASSNEFDAIRSTPDRAPSPRGPLAEDRDGAARAVGHEEWAPFTATPDGSGAWSHQEGADFDIGVLVGDATCGDPLADGFFYDLAVAVVDVDEPPVTVPPTVAPLPVPAPAAPVTGTPTYAG
jgi:hypothetical protein